MQNLLQMQYDLVIQSREVLLGYCGQLTEEDFLRDNSNFGRGSTRNLIVHIGNTYEFWLGKQALHQEINFTPYTAVNTVNDARSFFLSVNSLVNAFIFSFGPDYETDIPVTINNQNIVATPLKLFTHVITHEFHHKGQILSLSRHLGYVPVDTDIMR